MKPTRQLTLFDVSVLMISFVIGMGIFRTPVNVAAAVPTSFIFYAAWIVGGLIAFCGALTYAEIGSRLPVTGGYYKIFSYAYHPSIAFAVNCIILVSNAASLAAVAIVGGEYITGILIPQTKDIVWMASEGNAHYIQTIQIVIAIVAVTLFYGVNLLGLKMSARAQNVLTIIKVSMVILLISPLFFHTQSVSEVTQITSSLRPAMMEYIKAFGIGLVAVSFTYGGYQQTINFGEEVRNPKKTVPCAIFTGIAVIVVLYLLINYAYVKVIGFNELKSAKNIAAIMASKVFGENAERILSVLLFFSVLAYVNVLLMSNPRVMAAMADDKILPASFKKRNEKTGVLVTSLSVFSALCVLIIFWAKEFDAILSFTIFLDCFGMALSAGSIFIIRKKTANLDGTGIYKMKAYPLLPLIFITAYAFVAVSIFVTNTRISIIALAVLAAFIAIYFIAKAFQEKQHTTNKINFD